MAETNPNGANQYRCNKCGKLKDFNSFGFRSDNKTYRKTCKDCSKSKKNNGI